MLWRVVVALVRCTGAHQRFAVCITGQLRAGCLDEVQERLAAAVVRPLSADVFVVVSLEHKLGHSDFHIPTGGCHRDAQKCAPRNGSSGVVSSETSDFNRRWAWSQPVEREAASLDDVERLVNGPLQPVRVRVLNDSEAMESATRNFGPSHAGLFQRAFRARNRWCLADVEAREASSGVDYDWIVRVRPDYVFTACVLPPARAWPRPSRWGATHMDFWEVMDRVTATANLGIFNDPDPPTACLLGQRVESCTHYAMCRSGANVTAVELLDKVDTDSYGPRRPGEFVRPCCDPAFIPRPLLSPPPTRTWCALHRRPYLHTWWFRNANYTLPSLDVRHVNAQLGAFIVAPCHVCLYAGPLCVKVAPPRQLRDDDDDTTSADQTSATPIWTHEWALSEDSGTSPSRDIRGDELRR